MHIVVKIMTHYNKKLIFTNDDFIIGENINQTDTSKLKRKLVMELNPPPKKQKTDTVNVRRSTRLAIKAQNTLKLNNTKNKLIDEYIESDESDESFEPDECVDELDDELDELDELDE